MCDHPNREEAMTVIRRDEDGTPTVWCDPCIAPLVKALQPIGTVASCCGHGKQAGNIALADGRELLILPNYESARRAERLVALDGIDVEALRSADGFDREHWTDREVEAVDNAIRQVLAAIDQEGA